MDPEAMKGIQNVGIAAVLVGAMVLIMRHLLIVTLPELTKHHVEALRDQRVEMTKLLTAERDLWSGMFAQLSGTFGDLARQAVEVNTRNARTLARISRRLGPRASPREPTPGDAPDPRTGGPR